jgi:Leucine-rich repeat (LRR) protein
LTRCARLLLCVGIFAVLLAASGCTSGSKTYKVSGYITVVDSAQGVEEVTLLFSGDFGTAVTGADGGWAKIGLKGTVTVTPTKSGWTFTPTSRQVSEEPNSVDFTATDTNSDPVTFVDSNLEAAVRETIEKPEGQLTKGDVMNITRLIASEREISSLDGIGHLIGLEELDFSYNQISDLGPLSGLTELRILYATGN